MRKRRLKEILVWLKKRLPDRAIPLNEIDRARQLVAAIDRGGIPLNPVRVNAIARDLGLEVSRQAPMDETIERIRAALARLA